MMNIYLYHTYKEMQDNNKPDIAKEMGLLTSAEAADYMGISEGHFKQHISPKLIGVTPGKIKYFTKKELINWLGTRVTNVAQKAIV
jgi:hypothetical protein